MIATKTLLLMVMGLAGRENSEKAKNCRPPRRILGRVLARITARYIGILGFVTSSRVMIFAVIGHNTINIPKIFQVFYGFRGLTVIHSVRTEFLNILWFNHQSG